MRVPGRVDSRLRGNDEWEDDGSLSMAVVCNEGSGLIPLGGRHGVGRCAAQS